jgi:hypothetical protein
MRSAVFSLLCASCRVGTGVTYDTQTGGRSHTYEQSGTQRRPPAAEQPRVGEWVKGSDGSFGWRTATHAARAMFERVSDGVAKQCTVESRNQLETRADCNGVRIIVRRDDTNLYRRVCDSAVDVAHCITTWRGIP